MRRRFIRHSPGKIPLALGLLGLLFFAGGMAVGPLASAADPTPPPAVTADKPARTTPTPPPGAVPPPVVSPLPETPDIEFPEIMPVLVNYNHPLDKSFAPDKLVRIGNTAFQATPETAEAVQALLKAAREEGIRVLRVQSGYRSYNTQNDLHTKKIKALKAQYGDLAPAVAATIVAPPGKSEHQLGLAVDIAAGRLVTSFGDTEAGLWLAENAHRFGFVLRYPADKTEITRIIYEPWHLRYVGVETAGMIRASGLCLEEYWEAYETAMEESAP